ncbi:MAG: MmcQ/YjbR family DNA-binding protein [Sporocytophaga sp.]|nr:MmcQ/YjbR family DNA-binding protein [Sporocytophaga sp.]
MVKLTAFRKLALSLPEVTEEPHFEKISFRVKKKIFATFDEKNKRAIIKLSEIDQDLFSSAAKTIIYPVDNKWGKQGWTIIEMKSVDQKLFDEALVVAYCTVAPMKLAALVKQNDNG